MASHSAFHLALSLRMIAKPTSPWAGEVAMNTWRIACRPGGTAPFDYGSGTVDFNEFTVNDASTVSTTAHLNKVQAWTGDSGVFGINVTDGDQDGLAEAVWAYVSGLAAQYSSDYTLGDIRLYPIGSAGRMVSTAPCLYTPIVALPGTGTGLFPSAALVVSTSSAAGGRKGRGRWFAGPVTLAGIGSGGLAATGTQNAWRVGAKALLEGIRGVGGGLAASYTPVTWHRGTTTGAVINKVRVGDEYDVQQSRRHSRPEVYVESALT